MCSERARLREKNEYRVQTIVRQRENRSWSAKEMRRNGLEGEAKRREPMRECVEREKELTEGKRKRDREKTRRERAERKQDRERRRGTVTWAVRIDLAVLRACRRLGS